MNLDKNKYNTLLKQVRFCLAALPETRNSDIDLTIHVWQKFFPEYIKFRLNKVSESENYQAKCIDIADIKHLPREDHIKRIRAKIQNEQKEFLPTLPEVASARRLNETFWKEEMKRLYQKQYCKVRADLIEQNLAVPIVFDTKSEHAFLPTGYDKLIEYAWFDQHFRIFYNNKWYFAESIDFDF